MVKGLSGRSGEDGLNTSSRDGAQSEVARLLTQIDAEYEAASRGLQGLCYGMSQHAYITARMENMSRLHQELGGIIGDNAAMELITDRLKDHGAQETL